MIYLSSSTIKRHKMKCLCLDVVGNLIISSHALRFQSVKKKKKAKPVVATAVAKMLHPSFH